MATSITAISEFRESYSELWKLKVVLRTPKFTRVSREGGHVNCSLTLQLVSEIRAVLRIVPPLTSHGVTYRRKIPRYDFSVP